MKKILFAVLMLTLTVSFTSCRDKKARNDVKHQVEKVKEDVNNAAEKVSDKVQGGADAGGGAEGPLEQRPQRRRGVGAHGRHDDRADHKGQQNGQQGHHEARQ